MSTQSNSFNSPKFLPLLGAVFAVMFWVVDSAIDAWIFEEEHTFIESLFSPEPVELWMRILVVILMIILAMYAKKMLVVRLKYSEELSQYKDYLEQLVDERTKELTQANNRLNEEIVERVKAQNELERLATTDPLTLLINRRKFEELLDYEMERDKRYRTGLSFIFCDIDRFKLINDEYGHDAGDKVLKEFAKLLKNSIRASDIVARWGGEEFVLLIPNTTADIASVLAEKLRRTIDNHEFPIPCKVTASFGVTHFLGDDNQTAAIKRADVALYKAKENGRNRIEVLFG